MATGELDQRREDQQAASVGSTTEAETLLSVFLSYARADNEDGFLTEVYQALTESGFSVWWDHVSMPSRGLTFLQEIAEAIDAADRLLLILSPTAAKSDYVRAEWQYALVKDKVVTPVLRSGEFHLLPPELKGTHCEDVRATRDPREALEAIIRLAKARPPALARAETVPMPPPHYRPRPDQLARVAERLALERPEQLAVPSHERTIMIHGIGGVGKSILVAAIARSTATRRVFADEVIWVVAGPEAHPIAILQQIAKGLGEDLQQYGNEVDARIQLRKRLEHAAVLIVLDNVWSNVPVEPIREALGARCRLLITTREPGLVDLGTQPVELGPFSEEEALAYLRDRAQAEGRAVSPAMNDVARECGFLPFALALAGAMLAETSWETLAERLRAADLSFMEAAIPGYPYTNLLRALQVSVDHLRGSQNPGDRMAVERYLEIPAFRWETGVPEKALLTLWRARAGIDESTAGKVLTILSKRGLVRTQGQSPLRIVRIHDLQQDYLWAFAKDHTEQHAAILDAYASSYRNAPLVTEDDGYYLENYFYHLEHAGQAEQMHSLLGRETVDGRNAWWATRIAHGQVLDFVADVRRAWEHAWRNVSTRKPPDSNAVASAVRYALLIGSARAALTHVPHRFVNRLLDEKLWSAGQALAVLEWAARGEGVIDAFVAVIDHLPQERKAEAVEEGLRLARAQPEELDRARGLLKFVPFLSGDRRAQILEEALALKGVDSVHFLLDAHRAAPERKDLLDRAIIAATGIGDAFSLKVALLEMARSLPAERIEDVLPLTHAAGTPEEQAEALIELAARLPEERRHMLAHKALDLLADEQDFTGAGVTAVKRRARAVRLLPPPQRESTARAVIAELERLKWARHRLEALADVLPFLKGIERTRAEGLAYELAPRLRASDIDELLQGRRGVWLQERVPEFFQPLLSVLLDVARKESQSYTRTNAIAALLPFLDSDRAQIVLKQEEQISQHIGDHEARAKCVGALARTLAQPLRETVVECELKDLVNSADRVSSGSAVVALTPVATVKQLDAIAAALYSFDELSRGEVAAALLAANVHLGRWEQIEKLLPELDTPFHLRRALEAFPRDLPAEQARNIIAAAIATRDPEIGAVAIPLLCGHLADDERRNVCEIGLHAAEVLDAGRTRYQLLTELIPLLSCERLDVACKLIPKVEKRAVLEHDNALTALAVRRAECGKLVAAVDMLPRLSSADSHCRACARMSRYFPEPTATTLVEHAETSADIESTYSRVELLVEVARNREEPHRLRLVEKALAVARGIEKAFVFSLEEEKCMALASVAPLLDPEKRPGVIIEAWQNASKASTFDRVRLLEQLAPLIAELDPDRTAPLWRDLLERSSRDRRTVFEELQACAPLVARLAGNDGVDRILRDIEKIAKWWP